MTECKIKESDNCPAARGAAKSAVKDVFAILGVNVDDPAAVEETLSSRAWRIRAEWPTLHQIINGIMFNANHCQQAYESERLRLQSPPEER